MCATVAALHPAPLPIALMNSSIVIVAPVANRNWFAASPTTTADDRRPHGPRCVRTRGSCDARLGWRHPSWARTSCSVGLQAKTAATQRPVEQTPSGHRIHDAVGSGDVCPRALRRQSRGRRQTQARTAMGGLHRLRTHQRSTDVHGRTRHRPMV